MPTLETTQTYDLSVIYDEPTSLQQLPLPCRPFQHFYFSQPEWLRPGRHVSIEWIGKLAHSDWEDVTVINGENSFSFTRSYVRFEENLLTDSGIIISSPPESPATRRAASAQRLGLAFMFRPYASYEPNQFGELSLRQRPDRLIPLEVFDSYIISPLGREARSQHQLEVSQSPTSA
ncbi:MAG: hypothetical protein ABIV43_00325 [Candidatus Saccharimonadales bacterium]